MAKVSVFVEHKDGKIKKSSLELICAAKKSGAEVSAVAFGSGAKQLADELGSYGVGNLFACSSESLNHYNPEGYSAVLATHFKETAPNIVLASATSTGKDLLPRVAALLDCGAASDCTSLEISGENVSARRPLYAGKVSAEVVFQNSPTKIVIMRPNALPVNAPAGGGAAKVQELPAPTAQLRTTVKSIVAGKSNRPDLIEAGTIVSAGRGIKEPANLKIVEELANSLHASLGASRAVVDAGWAPHEMQVGQTGKTVSPQLYIAVGISGAIQHLAGMSSSKVIVAINKDKDAPIFQKCTYGLVGDLFEIVPALTQEFKKLLKE